MIKTLLAILTITVSQAVYTEPFQQPKEQPERLYTLTYQSDINPWIDNNPVKAPNKAPIDWNSLDYDNPIYGWIYRELWYLYHPNSTETPPWIKQAAIDKNIPWILLLILTIIYINYKKHKINLAHIKK